MLGNLICLSYLAIPWVITASKVPDHSVWVPVHDQYHICGDNPFYAAGIRQARSTPFTFNSPVADKVGTYWVEVFKEGSRLLAAGLSFGVHDERAMIVVSFIAGLLLNFSLLFWIGRALGLNAALSQLLGLLIIFWYPALLPSIGFLRYLREAFGTALLNDNFRLAVMHTSVIFLWATTLFCIHFTRWSFIAAVTFLILLVTLPYSYISVTISGAALLFASTVLLQKKPRVIIQSLGLGVLGLAGLTLIGFWEHLHNFLHADSQPVIQAHLTSRDDISTLNHIRRIARFMVPAFGGLGIAWYLAKENPKIRKLLLVTSFLTLIVVLFMFPKDLFYFAERSFRRGAGSVYAVAIAAAAFWAIDKRLKKWRRVSYIALLVGLVSLPLISSMRLGEMMVREGSLWISRSDWEAITYLKKTAPLNSNILAFDLTANQLLPIYADLHIEGASPTYSGNNSEAELDKLISAWKFVGLKNEILSSWLDRYPQERKAFQCFPAPNRPSWESVEGSLTLRQLIYDPYIIRIYGHPIFDPTETKLDPGFRRELDLRIARPEDPSDFPKRVEYIFLSKIYEERRITPYQPPVGYQLIFRNDSRTIYKRAQARS
jgi:hypothetical protein